MTDITHWQIFEPGRRYAAAQSFAAPSDRFREGEVVVFERTAVSIYHDMIGYFFIDENGKGRRWDIAWRDFDTIKARRDEWFRPA